MCWRSTCLVKSVRACIVLSSNMLLQQHVNWHVASAMFQAMQPKVPQLQIMTKAATAPPLPLPDAKDDPDKVTENDASSEPSASAVEPSASSVGGPPAGSTIAAPEDTGFIASLVSAAKAKPKAPPPKAAEAKPTAAIAPPPPKAAKAKPKGHPPKAAKAAPKGPPPKAAKAKPMKGPPPKAAKAQPKAPETGAPTFPKSGYMFAGGEWYLLGCASCRGGRGGCQTCKRVDFRGRRFRA